MKGLREKQQQLEDWLAQGRKEANSRVRRILMPKRGLMRPCVLLLCFFMT